MLRRPSMRTPLVNLSRRIAPARRKRDAHRSIGAPAPGDRCRAALAMSPPPCDAHSSPGLALGASSRNDMIIARRIATLLLCVLAVGITPALGQRWPAKPVRLVAVFPPGGS